MSSEKVFPVTVNVPYERVADLLCGAFEGGSNWATILQYVVPEADKLYSLKDAETWKSIAGDGTIYKHIQYPLSEGGAVVIQDLEEDESVNEAIKYYLTLAEIRSGLAVMANRFPRHFGDFMNENDDATTADVFLQCCVFGDVIYS